MRCDTYSRLYDAVAARTKSSSGVVVIDGGSGSGKSTATMRLAREMDGFRVSADSYVEAGRGGPYVDRLALDFLGDDIRRLRNCSRLVFFEGICARDVLGKLGIQPLMSIYIQTIATSGLWHLEFHLEDFANGDANREGEPFRSDYEYHNRVRPHENADVTYVRVAD